MFADAPSKVVNSPDVETLPGASPGQSIQAGSIQSSPDSWSDSLFWPGLNSQNAAVRESRIGMYTAASIASLTAILAGISVINGKVTVGVGFSALLDAVMFFVLALGIAYMNRGAAIAGIGLYVLEVLSRFRIGGYSGTSIVEGAFVLWLLIRGSRGVFAYHRLTQGPR
jgi:hypothetical protein